MKKKKTFRQRVHGIRFKTTAAIAVGGIILMIFSVWLLSASMKTVESRLFDDRLESDIRYARDSLGGNWNIKQDALYCGETFIGTGLNPNPSMERRMQHFEDVTGTFFYTFVRTHNDDELVYVESGGYQQGHYLRTAGTTKGPNGENLVGTYMDKKVADILDKKGVYSGEANVNGRMIYCRYELLKDNDGKTVGAIVVGRSMEEMQEVIGKQRTRGIILVIVMMVLISGSIGAIITAIIGSITKIRERLELIGSGVFPEEELEIHTHDELADVARSVNDMVDALKEKERLGAELSVATDIQANMLPRIFPAFPGKTEFDIFATMQPAKEVGGDFYDFFMVDEKHIAVVIADVSGKGVPAALFMVIAKTLIKNHAQTGLEPGEVFTMVNHVLCDGNEAGLFVTAWMGVLNIDDGTLTYVNAGHNSPLVKLGNEEYVYLKSRPGFVLAGMDGVKYRQNTIKMQPGDRLFLYTDGVTEATDDRKRLYGEQRLATYLNAHGNAALEDVLHGLRRNIDAFVGEEEQFDDITMLMLAYNRKGGRNLTEKTFLAADDYLNDAIAFVEQQLEKADCSPKTIMQITVCVEEMFVNVAHYAYQGKTGELTLGVDTSGGKAKIVLSDEGMYFDPLAKEDPDITLAAEDRKIGGLGILMVKKTMDEVFYERKDDKNVFTMIKKI